MNRQGHTGMALLAFAPLAYLLASDGKLLLAGVCWLGIQAVEPLPDRDFKIPGLNHRGVSHSLLAVLVVGVVLGGIGWLLGRSGFDLLYSLLTALVGIWDWVLGYLPELSKAFLTGLIPNLLPGEIVSTLQQQAGGSVSRWSFALFGFTIGAYGMVAHLLGDVITTRGVRPFLPFSRWRLSLSPLRADSQAANSALFGAGMVAIALVVALTVPGLILGGGPATLSPVGTAGAQGTIPQPTETTDTNASTNATVSLANQTINGSTVTVESVTLPEAGFIALDSTGPGEESVLEDSTIAVSRRLDAGTHWNVSLDVNRSPPGGVVNQTTLNQSGTYGAALYRDSNNNSRFEFITSGRASDRPFVTQSGSTARLVSDSASITIRGSREDPNATPAASIRFPDQRIDGVDVTVQSVTVPQGGFVVVHNQSYLRGGDPTETSVGYSQYLSAGTHRNVSITLLESVRRDQQLVAIPARDTDGNQSYDYIRTDSFQDVGYTDGGKVVTDTARATITGSISTAEATSSVAVSDTPTATGTEQPEANTTDSGGRVGAWIGSHPLEMVVIVLAMLVVVPSVWRRL
ncbi:DUF7282 domain-containing protein [Halococcus sediminicola]|uniref:DUF7282 domain-containing protein n=1 Tax=Halococcus sediminicola TaxID=1264579 RepID=UPI0009ABEC43|nr:metal-dependent hydrolase [Halococcus sediminicola]